jgi:hypothetical protein
MANQLIANMVAEIRECDRNYCDLAPHSRSGRVAINASPFRGAYLLRPRPVGRGYVLNGRGL